MPTLPPIKTAASSAAQGYTNGHALQSMPDEVLRMILSNLSMPELARVAKTCRRFRQIIAQMTFNPSPITPPAEHTQLIKFEHISAHIQYLLASMQGAKRKNYEVAFLSELATIYPQRRPLPKSIWGIAPKSLASAAAGVEDPDVAAADA